MKYTHILLGVHGLGELRVLGSEYDMRLGNVEVIRLTERLHRGRLVQISCTASLMSRNKHSLVPSPLAHSHRSPPVPTLHLPSPD